MSGARDVKTSTSIVSKEKLEKDYGGKSAALLVEISGLNGELRELMKEFKALEIKQEMSVEDLKAQQKTQIEFVLDPDYPKKRMLIVCEHANHMDMYRKIQDFNSIMRVIKIKEKELLNVEQKSTQAVADIQKELNAYFAYLKQQDGTNVNIQRKKQVVTDLLKLIKKEMSAGARLSEFNLKKNVFVNEMYAGTAVSKVMSEVKVKVNDFLKTSEDGVFSFLWASPGASYMKKIDQILEDNKDVFEYGQSKQLKAAAARNK